MITLIQISDCHLFSDKAKKGYAQISPYASLSSVLRAMQPRLQDNIGKTLVLTTGDISGDSSEQSYTDFVTLMREYTEAQGVPWYVLPGNHDNNPYFHEQLGHKNLTCDAPLLLDNWVIAGMDTRISSQPNTAKGEIRQQQLDSLAANVATWPDYHHLIALHHHIQPSCSWMDKHALHNAQSLEVFVSRTAQVKALIHGHIHSSLRQHIGDSATPSYGCPSTCWQWEMQAEFGVSREAPGYQILSLHSDGIVEVDVKRLALT
ncbi:3',5'-cyclic-AMP phosphodiesterase [Alteromonas sp. D210916BOD_24]|uniref:metallophosphoesterase n=1 Tax=Alteromonas sp. D210916BOD_24 TaxID=3157618 RepID=UPI00399C5639